MSDKREALQAFEASGSSPPDAPARVENVQKPEAKKDEVGEKLNQLERKQRRTTGLKLFDVFLYPLLTNFGVFAVSVWATYLTSKGGAVNAAGQPIHGKFGQWMARRGTWVDEKLTPVMGAKSAEMTRVVFFSFADGTLFAPLVKYFEDRREKIGKWVDDRLGTTPQDLSVYEREPKQTWGSVIMGRLATAVVVAPTAMFLDKIGTQDKAGQFANLNDRLFRHPGEKLGEWVINRPNLAKKFGELHIPTLARTSLFEAFYTTVCTGGLYMFSRAFARHHDTKTGRVEKDGTVTHLVRVRAPHGSNNGGTPVAAASDEAEQAKPSAQVHAVAANARIAQEHTVEATL